MSSSTKSKLIPYVIIFTMNHIQRAWLKVLSPVSGFVNDKLAKRSGMLGKLGRFYAFGPREFGYHPSNKILAYVNHVVVENMALHFHKHSPMKYPPSHPGASP